jgi:hypothetical protein
MENFGVNGACAERFNALVEEARKESMRKSRTRWKKPCNSRSSQNTSPLTPKVSKRKQRIHGKNLCVYRGHAKSLSACSLTTPRDIKVCISQIIIIQIEKNLRFILSTLYGMD